MAEVIPVLKAALDYIRRYAWRLIPLRPRSKVPLIKDWVQEASNKTDRLEEWFRQWPQAGIGVLLGYEAGTVVIDVDGPEGAAMIEKMHLPATLTATTSKGKHYFFRSPDRPIKKKIRVFPEIDLLGDGCFAVVAPSIHPSGYQYHFDNYGHVMAPLPENLMEKGGVEGNWSEGVHTQSLESTEWIPEGVRNDTLTSEAGKLRRSGKGYLEILKILLETNQERCSPPLDDAEVEGIAKSVSRYIPERGRFHLSDDGNAQRFIELHGREIRFCMDEHKRWYIWDGIRFKEDRTGNIHYLARDVAKSILDEADWYPKSHPNQHERKKLLAFSITSENQTRLKAMVDRASVDPQVAVTPEILDRDPMRLCVRNGYLNLRTGQLESPDPERLITRQAAVIYDPAAQCPRWLDLIDKATCGRKDLASFIQEIGGYLLTGETYEDKFFLFIGEGANGKSTILETWGAILGDYFVVPPSGTFLERPFNNPSAASPELAMLQGARLATMSETDKGDKVALGLLKRLSAGGKGSARELYSGLKADVPTVKIIIDSNHPPKITSNVHGTWRRVCRVPFDYKFEGSERIESFRQKMITNEYGEHSGILNWMLEGCRRWLENGHLTIPADVIGATETYKQQENPIARFIDERTIKGNGFSVLALPLYNALLKWCAENGERAEISLVSFADALKSLGFKKQKTKRGMLYLGLRLLTEDEMKGEG